MPITCYISLNCGCSLFFDPFMNRIYDYANGMEDVRSLKVILFSFTNEICFQITSLIHHVNWKFSQLNFFFSHLILSQLQTLIPARLSFQEDCGICFHNLYIWSFSSNFHLHHWICYNFNLTGLVYANCHAARILRGIRIAGRLGLSISKDTETAICKLQSSVKSLNKVLRVSNKTSLWNLIV